MILDALCNLDVEADEGQADAVRHADGRQEPDLGRRGALVLDVADDLLRRLALVALALHPLVQPGLLQGAVEKDEELDVAVEAGLGQGRQVAQHVVPLPAAHPVRVEPAVEPVQAVVGVDEEAQRGLRGPLPPPPHQAAPRQLLQLDGHHGAGAVLLDVVLEALHSHGEHRATADVAVAAAIQRGVIWPSRCWQQHATCISEASVTSHPSPQISHSPTHDLLYHAIPPLRK